MFPQMTDELLLAIVEGDDKVVQAENIVIHPSATLHKPSKNDEGGEKGVGEEVTLTRQQKRRREVKRYKRRCRNRECRLVEELSNALVSHSFPSPSFITEEGGDDEGRGERTKDSTRPKEGKSRAISRKKTPAKGQIRKHKPCGKGPKCGTTRSKRTESRNFSSSIGRVSVTRLQRMRTPLSATISPPFCFSSLRKSSPGIPRKEEGSRIPLYCHEQAMVIYHNGPRMASALKPLTSPSTREPFFSTSSVAVSAHSLPSSFGAGYPLPSLPSFVCHAPSSSHLSPRPRQPYPASVVPPPASRNFHLRHPRSERTPVTGGSSPRRASTTPTTLAILSSPFAHSTLPKRHRLAPPSALPAVPASATDLLSAPMPHGAPCCSTPTTRIEGKGARSGTREHHLHAAPPPYPFIPSGSSSPFLSSTPYPSPCSSPFSSFSPLWWCTPLAFPRVVGGILIPPVRVPPNPTVGHVRGNESEGGPLFTTSSSSPSFHHHDEHSGDRCHEEGGEGIRKEVGYPPSDPSLSGLFSATASLSTRWSGPSSQSLACTFPRVSSLPFHAGSTSEVGTAYAPTPTSTPFAVTTRLLGPFPGVVHRGKTELRELTASMNTSGTSPSAISSSSSSLASWRRQCSMPADVLHQTTTSSARSEKEETSVASPWSRRSGAAPLPMITPFPEGAPLHLPPSNYLTVEDTFRLYQFSPGFQRDVSAALMVLMELAREDTLTGSAVGWQAKGYPPSCEEAAPTPEEEPHRGGKHRRTGSAPLSSYGAPPPPASAIAWRFSLHTAPSPLLLLPPPPPMESAEAVVAPLTLHPLHHVETLACKMVERLVGKEEEPHRKKKDATSCEAHPHTMGSLDDRADPLPPFSKKERGSVRLVCTSEVLPKLFLLPVRHMMASSAASSTSRRDDDGKERYHTETTASIPARNGGGRREETERMPEEMKKEKPEALPRGRPIPSATFSQDASAATSSSWVIYIRRVSPEVLLLHAPSSHFPKNVCATSRGGVFHRSTTAATAPSSSLVSFSSTPVGEGVQRDAGPFTTTTGEGEVRWPILWNGPATHQVLRGAARSVTQGTAHTEPIRGSMAPEDGTFPWRFPLSSREVTKRVPSPPYVDPSHTVGMENRQGAMPPHPPPLPPLRFHPSMLESSDHATPTSPWTASRASTWESGGIDAQGRTTAAASMAIPPRRDLLPLMPLPNEKRRERKPSTDAALHVLRSTQGVTALCSSPLGGGRPISFPLSNLDALPFLNAGDASHALVRQSPPPLLSSSFSSLLPWFPSLSFSSSLCIEYSSPEMLREKSLRARLLYHHLQAAHRALMEETSADEEKGLPEKTQEKKRAAWGSTSPPTPSPPFASFPTAEGPPSAIAASSRVSLPQCAASPLSAQLLLTTGTTTTSSSSSPPPTPSYFFHAYYRSVAMEIHDTDEQAQWSGDAVQQSMSWESGREKTPISVEEPNDPDGRTCPLFAASSTSSFPLAGTTSTLPGSSRSSSRDRLTAYTGVNSPIVWDVETERESILKVVDAQLLSALSLSSATSAVTVGGASTGEAEEKLTSSPLSTTSAKAMPVSSRLLLLPSPSPRPSSFLLHSNTDCHSEHTEGGKPQAPPVHSQESATESTCEAPRSGALIPFETSSLISSTSPSISLAPLSQVASPFFTSLEQILSLWFEAFLSRVSQISLYTHRNGILQREFLRVRVEQLQSHIPPTVLHTSMWFTRHTLRYVEEHCTILGAEYALVYHNGDTPSLQLVLLSLPLSSSLPPPTSSSLEQDTHFFCFPL